MEVNKLEIKGIRTFKSAAIDFVKPELRTIIKCLKVACSGQLPPNVRSGHNFIRDPRLDNDLSTQAKIGLQFQTAHGNSAGCIRKFAVEEHGTKIVYKAVSVCLNTRNNKGEVIQQYLPISDTENTIPNIMGISKVLLDHVIFVHQDESDWPMKDPSTLKKKFDDLFSTNRYTDALDNLKKVSKDLAVQMQNLKLQVNHSWEMRGMALKEQESIQKDEEAIEAAKKQVEELEVKIQKVNRRIKKKNSKVKKLKDVQDRIDEKVEEKSLKVDDLNKCCTTLTEQLEGTEEVLNGLKDESDKRINNLKAKFVKYSEKQSDTAAEIRELKQQIAQNVNRSLNVRGDDSLLRPVETADRLVEVAPDLDEQGGKFDKKRVNKRKTGVSRTKKEENRTDVTATYSKHVEDIDSELKESQTEQNLLNSQLKGCETSIVTILNKVDKYKEKIMKEEVVMDNIKQNLECKKLEAQCEDLTGEIESLKKSSQKIGRLSEIEAELVNLVAEKERFQAEVNEYQGTIPVYQSSIDEKKHKLETQFKGIFGIYNTQFINLTTGEMAIRDLDKYFCALLRAVSRFHETKMAEINQKIMQLWQGTYTGDDISSIRIHLEFSKDLHSYSYKVLMLTGFTECEMRGRCSAGQKVIQVSLVIRLALAETMCPACGILALDEPTTNLDGPNSDSLAASILRIMENRKGQDNFQLIVITHDERFVDQIGRGKVKSYYKITKDESHSKIAVVKID